MNGESEVADVLGQSRGREAMDTFSHVRHSLRTPLSQIIGYSEMLREEASDTADFSIVTNLDKIHRAGTHLLALVDDTFATWRIEQGMVDLDTVRVQMRSPLNLVIGYSELAEEEAADTGHTSVIPDLQRIGEAARNFLGMFEQDDFPTAEELARLLKLATVPQDREMNTVLSGWSEREEQSAPAAAPGKGYRILVVDDNSLTRRMLKRRLRRQGFDILTVNGGKAAFDLLNENEVDLILLDILMPEMDGYTVLEGLKSDENLKHIPVIMLSAIDEIDSVIRCIEIGAEDYLPKPFNPVLLQARIDSFLERKRLRDQETKYLSILTSEREKSETLLLNILPRAIAERLKNGETVIADYFPEATVMFTDLVGFTPYANHVSPQETVRFLNDIFSGFDTLAEVYRMEKIKTIGDSYMVVGGVPDPLPDHAVSAASMALEMMKLVEQVSEKNGASIQVRIGISSGPLVAGVLGRKKFAYDLWGDTVNVASRMESTCEAGRIQVSASTQELLGERFRFESRGEIEVKGKGSMLTSFLLGKA